LAAIAKTVQEKSGAKNTRRFLFTGELGKKIGEGFDLPELDTLLIAMPVSFRGKLIQYAGRLHRPHTGKSEVTIYDYVDTSSPLTISMFKKRANAYRKMEYSLETPSNFKWHLKTRNSPQPEFSYQSL